MSADRPWWEAASQRLAETRAATAATSQASTRAASSSASSASSSGTPSRWSGAWANQSSTSSAPASSSRTGSSSSGGASSAADAARVSQLTSQRTAANARLSAIAGEVTRLGFQVEELTDVIREVEELHGDAERVRSRVRGVPVDDARGWVGAGHRSCDGSVESCDGSASAGIRRLDRVLTDLRRRLSLLSDQVDVLGQERRTLEGTVASTTAELGRLR